jgi:uncharacterized protein YdhG (YjbR/CyaY superfamily)
MRVHASPNYDDWHLNASDGEEGMTDRPTNHDDYLASLDEPARFALEALRRNIRAAAPEAEEYIGYGVPAFRQDGALVSYGAAKAHLSFYVQSPAVMEAHAAQLADFKTSKGAVSFTPDKTLPASLVKTLVLARLAENAARRVKQ